MTRAGGDDVTIRVGSARGSREGFTATQRDLTQVGQEVGNLRRDFEQLGRMDAEPQVQLQGAQDAAGDLGRVDAALRGFNGQEATGRVTVDAGAARGDIQAAEGELHKIDGET